VDASPPLSGWCLRLKSLYAFLTALELLPTAISRISCGLKTLTASLSTMATTTPYPTTMEIVTNSWMMKDVDFKLLGSFCTVPGVDLKVSAL